MRLIDADLAIEQLKGLYNYWEREKLGFSALAVATCITKISELPTIDAVPVIRCKDCTWFESEEENDYGLCINNGTVYKRNDFCSDAERKV